MAFASIGSLAGHRPSTIERAYELARSGSFAKVVHLRKRLKAEGYGDYRAQLSGVAISRVLQRLCSEAWDAKSTPPRPGNANDDDPEEVSPATKRAC
ncbi:MAG: hypothetical protein ABI306_09725 [Caulobacteraceae bacterium]